MSWPAGKRGKCSEDQARRYLEKQGLKTLQCNFRTRRGEIDLIMLDTQTLVFVEVRYRKGNRYGSAAESVTAQKQQRLTLAARQFLLGKPRFSNSACRFDVIALSGEEPVEIEWIKDAFQLTG
ncbi:MAG: YraN family protein [Gammaproteobacteria bacterium]|nr:YraN family protein [Gammaproteobacteria bacterium]